MSGRKSTRARTAHAVRADDTATTRTVAQGPDPRRAPEQASPEKGTGAGARTDRVIQGIYFRAGVFALAKAAYVRDFYDLPDSPGTIAQWVGRCIERHCDRTLEQRRTILAGIEQGGPRGDSRTFKIPSTTQARMRQTVATDARDGLVSSLSEFAGAALAAAIDAATKRAGGDLTPITRRLPNRLIRLASGPDTGPSRAPASARDDSTTQAVAVGGRSGAHRPRRTEPEPSTPAATGVRRTRRPWWVVETRQNAAASEPVVLMGSHTSQRAATTAARKLLATQLGSSDPDPDLRVEVRHARDITAYRTFDTTLGRAVTKPGPPP